MDGAGKQIRQLPYSPLTLGLIHPEWLFMSYYLMKESDEEEQDSPPETTGDEAEKNHDSIRINFHARRDPAVP